MCANASRGPTPARAWHARTSTSAARVAAESRADIGGQVRGGVDAAPVRGLAVERLRVPRPRELEMNVRSTEMVGRIDAERRAADRSDEHSGVRRIALRDDDRIAVRVERE